MLRDKKGQVAETATWVVATLAIVSVLAVSVFLASLVGKGKSFQADYETDLLAAKSLTGYLLTKEDSGNIIYEQLKSEENLNQFNGNLAVRIFDGFYGQDYSRVIWFGINSKGFSLDRKNDYFGSYAQTSTRKGGDIVFGYYSPVSEKIYLNENKWIELVLIDE